MNLYCDMILSTQVKNKYILHEIFKLHYKQKIMKNLLIPLIILLGISLTATAQESAHNEHNGTKEPHDP